MSQEIGPVTLCHSMSLVITLTKDCATPLIYSDICPICMRTEMGPKIGLCPIPLQMESMKFGRRSNPFWVHKWPVGSEVQSHMCMFVAVDQSLPTSETLSQKILHTSLLTYLPP